MHDILLFLHNLLRWFVIIGGLASIIMGVRGWLGNRQWSATDDKPGMLYTIFLDIQLLLGLLLYAVFSPITTTHFSDFGAAMGITNVRFFLVEHLVLMVLAIIIAHIGRARVHKMQDSLAKYKAASLFYGISFLLVLLAIPWPFLSYGRPLLPF